MMNDVNERYDEGGVFLMTDGGMAACGVVSFEGGVRNLWIESLKGE